MEKNHITRTAIGIMVQAAKLLGRPYTYLKYTTLNEKYNILPEAHFDLTEAPDIKYWAIGRGGHRVHVDDTNTPVFDPVSHETTNTGPFQGVPFVLRQLNDDLLPDDRKNYALRRKETHNGIEYWAYYLKRLPELPVAPDIIHDNTRDGVTVSRMFKYTNDDLHPTPSDLPNDGVVISSADIIRISSKVTLDFNEWDVTEFYKVNKILYGNSARSMLSEILICSGVDKEIMVESGGSQVRFKEAVGVQVITFISAPTIISSANRGFYHEFELGEGEPLLTKGETRSTRYSLDVQPSTESATLSGTAYDASWRNNPASTSASIAASKPTTTPNGSRQVGQTGNGG